MLIEAQRSELRDHLSARLRQMDAVTKTNIYSYEPTPFFSQALLDHAVRFVADQRGIRAPKLAEPTGLSLRDAIRGSNLEPQFRDGSDSAIGEVLSHEADWLGGHQDLLSGYGSELLRLTTARRWDLERAASLTSRALEDVVSTVVAALLPEKTGGISVFDPTCGVGTLLNAVASLARDRALVRGQDNSNNAARLAAQNLFIAGRDAIIRTGDTLAEDAFPGEVYNVVISDAPYEVSREHDGKAAYEQFRFISPRKEVTFQFIQALLAKLKRADEGGGIGVFLSAVNPLTSTAKGYSEIREAIGGLDVLHSVIALPDGLNAISDIRLFALVFSTRKADDWQGRTKLVDLRGLYEDDRSGPERRKLKAQALTDLKREIGSPRDSAIGRFIPTSRFSFWRLPLARPTISRAAGSGGARRADYWITVPAETSILEWLADRYPLGSPPDVLNGSVRQVIWDIDRIFKPKDREELLKSLKQTGWPSTRLSAFVAHFHHARSAASTDSAGGSRLKVPVYHGYEAIAGGPKDIPLQPPGIDIDLLPGLDPAFMAGWLNSSAGRLARTVAASAAGVGHSHSQISRNDAWTLIDEIIVPVPEPSIQEAFAAVNAATAAGHQRLRELDESMWRAPSTINEARQAASKLLTTQSLDDWAQTLPYPIASSLATVLANTHPTPQQYRHFWEATTIFLACYLLGALQQDGSLWDVKIPTLLETVKRTGSSFDRATFGTWKAVLDQLSKLFREGLNSTDADERARYGQLLGNPPRDLITRILDPEVVRLVSDAILMRNQQEAHAGAMSSRQVGKYSQNWDTLTRRLRDAIGNGFSEFALVRPSQMEYDGEKFLNHTKSLIGPTIPFKALTVPTLRPLPTRPFPDYLYLVSTSGDYTRLAPFVRIGSRSPVEEPDDADFTCYFYSRREGGKNASKLLFITYQLSREDHIIREYTEVLSLLEALTPPSDGRNDTNEDLE